MKRGLYCVYDEVAEDLAIGMIDLARHEAVAVRNFGEAVMAPKSRLAQNPDDYSLVRLGWLHEGENGNPLRLEDDFHVVMSARMVLTLANRELEHPNAGELHRDDGTVTINQER